MAKNENKAGGANAALVLPEGFTTEGRQYYAPSVQRHLNGMLPYEGRVRLLLVTTRETTPAQVQALLANPRYRLQQKAPGVWEATVTPEDMDPVIAPNAGKMFRWIDLANRLYGTPVAEATDVATVAVAYDGTADEARKKLKQLGFTLAPATKPEGESDEDWVDPDEGLLVGTIPGGKIADLALATRITSIEVRAVRKAEPQG
jgi:hypothetical protein